MINVTKENVYGIVGSLVAGILFITFGRYLIPFAIMSTIGPLSYYLGNKGKKLKFSRKDLYVKKSTFFGVLGPISSYLLFFGFDSITLFTLFISNLFISYLASDYFGDKLR